MHFDLSQCQQTAPNLYKCPGVDKSICGAFYSGQQVDYISLDKDGNVIVMKRYSSNAICRLTFADRIGKDLRALLYRSFLRRNSDFRFEIFRVDDIKLVRKLMRHWPLVQQRCDAEWYK